MANRFRFDGLRELRANLRKLPEELRDEGRDIVVNTANAAADELRSRYPKGETGNLIKGVKVVQATQGTAYGIRMVVKNIAPHAIIYERGTEMRYYKGQARGKMQPTHLFVRTVDRHRHAMYEKLRALLRSKFDPGSFTVS